MEIEAKYNPQSTENKWYKHWMDNGYFKSKPDGREPYTIVIPPPNVTGILHMGHMLNNTIQDVLIRRARMKGKNTLWVPGTDHASIATEAKVVDKLLKEGINKADLSREEFLKHAWEWKEKHGGIILEQLKKLGASCDWDRTKFTMDADMTESVIDVFIDLYRKGKVYRGVRMVNWDPQAKTAVSDEEVIYKELQSKLYYVRYKVVGSTDQWVTIATTRPETILGDTAVCVNPADERFKHLKGKKVFVPLIEREVPVIEDSYVDMEFGTGCLKITPAHDINDYEIGIRHNLPSVDIFNPDGTLSTAAQIFVGLDRFEVRKLITAQLQAEGHIVKIEDYVNKVGFSERTDSIIEPRLSMQWFLKMKEISEPALRAVMDDIITIIPEKYKNTYRHWMENVRDWCISRQLWWGQRIPVFYLPNSNEHVVAKTINEALELARTKTGNSQLQASDLRQDEDVMDTWFSSWLWPISVFDGIRNPENDDIKYYYPTNDLVTAPEILFFWVARMIIAGYIYRNEKPFSNVYLTGIVRDKLGRKMSKQLGNSPDPLELMKIYGADGVRVGMLLCSPAGGDLLYDDSLPEQGRNFGNKIWNALRLLKSWNVDENIPQPESSKKAIEWFDNKLNELIISIEQQFQSYRISEALMTIYKLFWDEFSAWYLEMIKPAYGSPIDSQTYNATILFFDKLSRLLHPFMPFITEEIWHLLAERKENESIMISAMPEATNFDKEIAEKFEYTKQVITQVRAVRAQKNISPKEAMKLCIAQNEQYDTQFDSIVVKLANISEIEFVAIKPEGAASFIVKTVEYFIPLSNMIDKEEEVKKLQEQLKYSQGFLESVNKKLSNERFVNGAPAAVLEKEYAKKADAEAKIKALEEQISALQ